MTVSEEPLAQPARPLWGRLAVVGLVAAVVAALGFAALWWRASPPAEGSPEVTFSRDMIAHHSQAVAMALNLRDRTADEKLRTLLLDMALTQQGQIGIMQGWLDTWGRPFGDVNPPMGGMGEMMGMAKPEQVDSLRTLPADQAEVLFLQLMIRHHQGALLMAKDVLAKPVRPEVARLASSIQSAQQSEIDLMRELLKQRGGAPPEPLAPMPMEHTSH